MKEREFRYPVTHGRGSSGSSVEFKGLSFFSNLKKSALNVNFTQIH